MWPSRVIWASRALRGGFPRQRAPMPFFRRELFGILLVSTPPRGERPRAGNWSYADKGPSSCAACLPPGRPMGGRWLTGINETRPAYCPSGIGQENALIGGRNAGAGVCPAFLRRAGLRTWAARFKAGRYGRLGRALEAGEAGPKPSCGGGLFSAAPRYLALRLLLYVCFRWRIQLICAEWQNPPARPGCPPESSSPYPAQWRCRPAACRRRLPPRR